jgi:HK97 family phage portal protein
MGIFGIDWLGIEKKSAAKEVEQIETLKKEISDIVNGSSTEGRARIHDWSPSEQNYGREQRVNYSTLEAIYKRESWVRACIDAIARTSTSNGFRLVTEDPNDQRELTRRETRRILKFLKSPNPNDSFSDIIAEVVTDLHLYGDAYLEIVKDKKGLPIAIYNIYAPSVKVLVNRQGKVLGYIQNADGSLRTGAGNDPVIFSPNDVVHFKLPNPGNEVYGLSPIESLFTPIQTDLHAQDYNLNFFKNNATPKLHVDLGNCTLPQLKRTKEFFNREFKGQPHKTLVTEGGVKVSPIGVNPADMEFLNQRKFSREEICAVFGVPPMKIGIFDDVNRASAKEADKSFKAEKVTPIQRTIAKKTNKCIISLFNQPRVKFEFVELDLRDEKEQAAIDKLNIEAGILTVNEVRKRKGLPPLDPSQAEAPQNTPAPEMSPEERSENEQDVEDNRISNNLLCEPLEKAELDGKLDEKELFFR